MCVCVYVCGCLVGLYIIIRMAHWSVQMAVGVYRMEPMAPWVCYQHVQNGTDSFQGHGFAQDGVDDLQVCTGRN